MQIRRNAQRGGAVLAGALALGLAVAGFGGVSAQNQGNTLDDAPRPGHIHEGSCADLGGVAYPLTNATLNGVPEGALGLTEYRGSQDAFPVEISETEIEGVSLDDLLSGQYAINFHESDDNIQNYIACGDIGGNPQDNDLHIGLGELNNSGYTGIAVIDGDDDDSIEVTVYLSRVIEHEAAPTAAPPTAATPDATPSAEASAEPTDEPSAEPTDEPSAEPTDEPSAEPTDEPSAEPTDEPSAEPTDEPSAEPTDEPSAEPTDEPSAEPTDEPTEEPSAEASEPGEGEGDDA